MRSNPKFPTLLEKIGLRYLLRHPWQSLLMVLGIALGVTVVVAVDLANASAARAFDLSTESLTGRATHQITNGTLGLDDFYYTELRRTGKAPAAAPILSVYTESPQLGARPFQLLGIDPFADAPFRSYLSGGGSPSVVSLTPFFTHPGAVLISNDVAIRYGVKVGDTIQLDLGGQTHPAFIAGLLQPADTLARRALDGLILADLSTVQELTGRLGKIDRIDLILRDNEPLTIQDLIPDVPESLQLSRASARAGAVEQMTSAFRTNLTALSMLALLVGLFLIYNTMTFTVVQRRGLFGAMRCLGVTRWEVFRMVVVEALAAGIVGSALGIGFGIWMGRGLVGMVTQTITDLYFTTTVTQVGLPVSSLIKGGVLGILATILTAAAPAWEAASVSPQTALSRSGQEMHARANVGRNALLGGGSAILSGLIFLLPSSNLLVGFGGTFFLVVGFALLSPLMLTITSRLASRVTGRWFGFIGKMSPRNLVNSLSRTSVAVAALMIAVAVSIGVGLMVNSFRHTVILWMDQTLQGDIYLSAPSFSATTPDMPIDPGVVEALRTWQGVRRVDSLRSVTSNSPRGPVEIYAVDNPDIGQERIFLSSPGTPGAVWQGLQDGGVLVSEPFAARMKLPRKGGVVALQTAQGLRDFPVNGIYYDYASSQGLVLMSLDVYRRYWNDPAVTALTVRLVPGVNVDLVSREFQDQLSNIQQLVVRPNAELRKDVLAVFDRTFAITTALQALAMVVAFIGILSALMLLQLEKQREVGVLRAIGLTARQLWGMVMLETGLIGATAGILAMPTGLSIALVLIYVINKRSFGWTLQPDITAAPFFQAFAVALAASLLAGIYPARKLGKMAAAEAIRNE